MSPFSHLLYEIRTHRDIRQAELAELLGYEQSYISALEVGLKGPPTDEFIDRLIQALSITQSEEIQLRMAAKASQRKLIIDSDAPRDVFWLLNDLRSEVKCLKPGQVRMIREILGLRESLSEERRAEPPRRLKRRSRKEEVTM
jgi:transcriptional regulator with XRE-family HTH domain